MGASTLVAGVFFRRVAGLDPVPVAAGVIVRVTGLTLTGGAVRRRSSDSNI